MSFLSFEILPFSENIARAVRVSSSDNPSLLIVSPVIVASWSQAVKSYLATAIHDIHHGIVAASGVSGDRVTIRSPSDNGTTGHPSFSG